MPDSIPQTLMRWKRWAEPRYRSIGSTAESAVVRWEWANGPIYRPEPLYYERTSAMTVQGHGNTAMNPARHKLLKRAPKRVIGCYQYGFDASGGLRVARAFTHRDRQTKVILCREEFFVYRAKQILGILFNDDPFKNALNVSVQIRRGDSLEVYAVLGEALTIERYSYRHGRLAHIDWEVRTSKGGKRMASRNWTVPLNSGLPIEIE